VTTAVNQGSPLLRLASFGQYRNTCGMAWHDTARHSTAQDSTTKFSSRKEKQEVQVA
jgi:hypothetical protein